MFLCISSLLAFASASGFGPHLGYAPAPAGGPIVAGGIVAEQIPNEFKYAVADSYTGTQYARGESADGAGNRYPATFQYLAKTLQDLHRCCHHYPQTGKATTLSTFPMEGSSMSTITQTTTLDIRLRSPTQEATCISSRFYSSLDCYLLLFNKT